MEAWDDIKKSTITNCFLKTGLFNEFQETRSSFGDASRLAEQKLDIELTNNNIEDEQKTSTMLSSG